MYLIRERHTVSKEQGTKIATANKNLSNHGYLHEYLVSFIMILKTNQKATMVEDITKACSKGTVEVCPKWPHCHFQITQKAAFSNHIQLAHSKTNMQRLQPMKIDAAQKVGYFDYSSPL